MDPASNPPEASSVAALTGTVLAREAQRRETRDDAPILDPAALPGANEEAMSLRRGLALGGGAFTFTVLLLLAALDQLEGAAMSVLGPDIGTSLHVSEGAIVFITSASAAFVVVGMVPLGWLADRVRRAPIVGVASAIFGVAAALSGLAVNAFMLFWTRFLAGIAKANTVPVHGSLLADTYPIGIRGRMASTIGTATALTAALSPVLVGAIAVAFGGAAHGGWRWAFILMGVPAGVMAVAAFRIREPERGRWENRSVLGTTPSGHEASLISVEMAFDRLLQIRTLRTMVFALAAIGFQLFPMVSLTNYFLRDTYHLDAFHRGLVASAAGVFSLAVLPLIGTQFDRIYRAGPDRALRVLAWLIVPGAIITPLQFSMPNPWLFTLAAIPGTVLAGAAFAMVGPLVQGVVPYRLRSLGVAFAALYVFLIGAVGGALLGAAIESSFGPKAAIIAIAIPSSLVGAVLLHRGASSIDEDLSRIVAEISEEDAERQRRAADPSHRPLLQVSDVEFSYGGVQVLFGVSFAVARGETVALTGTNGAGKSTILRVIAGLGTPSHGAVRLDGTTVTFTSPEQRTRLGVQLLPGGHGVFPTLSVAENLEMGAYILDPAVRTQRLDRVGDLFPDLRARSGQRAGSLSGGQQQQLALARVMLHDPQVLLIDELSLGLAPGVVGELLETIERLKAAGQTMIIVEQSLNIATALADRAIFLERGEVRFDGPARDLLDRHDLARAVFLADGAR